jgi:hypothetical protein
MWVLEEEHINWRYVLQTPWACCDLHPDAIHMDQARLRRFKELIQHLSNSPDDVSEVVRICTDPKYKM